MTETRRPPDRITAGRTDYIICAPGAQRGKQPVDGRRRRRRRRSPGCWDAGGKSLFFGIVG